MIGRAVGGVHHDFQTVQIEPRRGAFAEFDVAAAGVVDAAHLAETVGGDHRDRLIQHAFDFRFDLIAELAAVVAEKLDAVVGVGVVRRGNHDARLGVQGAGQIGDRRCGHGPEQPDVHAGGGNARFQGRLEHVPGNAGVLADQDLAATVGGQHPAGGPAQLEHEIRRDRRFPDGAANAIGAEIFATHP